MKRILTIILCVLLVASIAAGCNKKVVGSGTTESSAQSETTQSANESETKKYQPKSTDALFSIKDVPKQNLDAADAEYQKKAPEKGEEVAVIHTNYGDISFKFFPEVAPMAVTSFKALAKAGRYDNTIFHRVTSPATDNGMGVVQGGDYTNFNGTGGASAYGEEYDIEVSDYLSNIEGSVAMAKTNMPKSIGSQFYINYTNNNFLDGGYTVFGQVYEGMDVVNEIAKVKVDSSRKPIKDVVVESVELVSYGG